MPRVETPRYGWCVGDHSKRQRVPAQSGYTDPDGRGYCKACFKLKFPEVYAAKAARRGPKICPLCGVARELLKGICRPCGRRCACDTCGDINHDLGAPFCVACSGRDGGAAPGIFRLALWCPKEGCTTDADRRSGLCAACAKVLCNHCDRACAGDSTQHTCVEQSCGRRCHVCEHCSPLRLGGRQLHCKSCWGARGKACTLCSGPARHHPKFFRCCQACHTHWFCKSCNAAHDQGDPVRCVACHVAAATWCTRCCTPEQLASGLCEPCFKKEQACCQHCFAPADAGECSWHPCATEGCARLSY